VAKKCENCEDYSAQQLPRCKGCGSVPSFRRKGLPEPKRTIKAKEHKLKRKGPQPGVNP
jgi:hypothetical protein